MLHVRKLNDFQSIAQDFLAESAKLHIWVVTAGMNICVLLISLRMSSSSSLSIPMIRGVARVEGNSGMDFYVYYG